MRGGTGWGSDAGSGWRKLRLETAADREVARVLVDRDAVHLNESPVGRASANRMRRADFALRAARLLGSAGSVGLARGPDEESSET